MKANKSIDGLSTRSSKKSPSKSTTTKKPAKQPVTPIKITETKNPVTQPDEPNITITESITEPATSLSSTEDFLSPVQAFDFSAETGELTATTTPSDNTSPESSDMTSEAKDAETPSETKQKTKQKSAKKASQKLKKKPGRIRRAITIILLIIVLAAIGFVVWGVFWGNDIIAKITGGQGNVLDLFTFTTETYDPLKTDANGRTNILAFGTSGFNMDGDSFDGTHDGAALTDSIMLISLNQETGDIAMLSLPRDLKASPTCTATGKINEVYWCNNIDDDNEQAGAEALMTEVGSILGIDFQYYAHLNWGSLVSIVDLLGGIEITLDEDIADYGWTDAVFEAGVTYTINGEQALGLARARHGTMGGDFTRGASQQKILIGIKNKLFEKNLSITDLLSLASTLGDNLRTNFSLNDMKTLAHLTKIFDLDSMRQIALVDYQNNIYYMTTGMINGISYVIPAAGVGNYGAIQEYVAVNLSNDPRDYEAPTILVLNATDTAGLAGLERDALITDGYKNVTADNAPEGDYTKGTTIYDITGHAPGTKHMLDLHYNSDVLSVTDLPESITTRDYDFIIILNPEIKNESSNQ